MNFDLRTTEWYQIPNLIDGATYVLQSKIKTLSEFQEIEILFTQGVSEPPELDDGILASDIKFKKRENENVYIRTMITPTNIQVEAA